MFLELIFTLENVCAMLLFAKGLKLEWKIKRNGDEIAIFEEKKQKSPFLQLKMTSNQKMYFLKCS